jgi:hypothetical protein
MARLGLATKGTTRSNGSLSYSSQSAKSRRPYPGPKKQKVGTGQQDVPPRPAQEGRKLL